VDAGELSHFCSRDLAAPNVKIIFFGRSQDELVESQYNQMIKLVLCGQTFEEYVSAELTELDFFALLAPWAAHFGKENIVARVYDGAGQSVIGDFLRCLPLSSRVISQLEKDTPSSNVSVGYLALQLFRTLNQFVLPRQRSLYHELNRTISAIDPPALFFDAQEARAFRDRFRSSNEVFIREYLNGQGSDLGGRKYSDLERDRIRGSIQKMSKSH
jgi:hypothetical protein